MTNLNQKDYIKLATEFAKWHNYERDTYDRILATAKEHGAERDFIGLPTGGMPLFSVIEDMLGYEFCYWCYDCNQDFNKYNKNVTYEDGGHPMVECLADLWVEEQKNPKEDK